MQKAVKALSIILICWCSLIIVFYLGIIMLAYTEWAPPDWLWTLMNRASYLLYGGILIVPLLFVATMVLLTILRIRQGPLPERLLRLTMGATAECLIIPLILFIDTWYLELLSSSNTKWAVAMIFATAHFKYSDSSMWRTLKKRRPAPAGQAPLNPAH